MMRTPRRNSTLMTTQHDTPYEDAFAVVTAQDYDCVLLTGDPEFHSVANEGLIAVEWLTRH